MTISTVPFVAEQGEQGGRGSPKQKFGGTRGIVDTRAQIFFPQTTEELPKKYHEAGTPEQKSITDTLRCLLVPTNNAKGILEYLSRDMLMAECSVSSD